MAAPQESGGLGGSGGAVGSSSVDAQHSRTRSGGRATTYPDLPDPLPLGGYDNHTHPHIHNTTPPPPPFTHLDIHDGITPLTVCEHLDRAAAVGVVGIVQVGVDMPSSRWSVQLAAAEPRVLAAVAVHPNEAPVLAASGDLDAALSELNELAAHPRVRAVGETGLDFFRTGVNGREAQFRSFEGHVDIAKRHGIALQIHDRDAHDDVVATLRRVGAPERTVFHCFSGDAELARLAADEGWYLSFAGTVTFSSAHNLRAALAVTPLDRMLVETDAPFLTPAPQRGRPNAPYLVPHTVRYLAAQLDVPLAEVCAALAANTVRVYGGWQDAA